VAGVLDTVADKAYAYQDETLDTTVDGPTAPTPTAGPTYIGHTFSGSEFFKGFVDEVHISKKARNAAWIRASYRNQSAPATYQTLGPETPLVQVSGTVFEDVNYGGGVGRDLATAAADAPSFAVGRDSATVELYDNAGSFVASTTTAGGERPSNEDAAVNSGAQTLAALQGTDLDTDGITEWTQSVVTVDTSGGDVGLADSLLLRRAPEPSRPRVACRP
jgi:hypothetical protein